MLFSPSLRAALAHCINALLSYIPARLLLNAPVILVLLVFLFVFLKILLPPLSRVLKALFSSRTS